MRRIALVVSVVAFSAAAHGGAPAGPTAPGPGTSPPGGALDSLGKGITGISQAAIGYAGGRLADLADIFELNIGIGPGIKAGVEYGIGRTTLGYVESTRIGMDGRQVGMWSEKNASYGIFPLSLVFLPFELVKGAGGVWEGLATDGFEIGSIGAERISRDNFATTTILYEEAVMAGPVHERVGDMCSVGGELYLGVVGARARVKPLEIFDFFLGFVGVDLDRHLQHPRPFRQPGRRASWGGSP